MDGTMVSVCGTLVGKAGLMGVIAQNFKWLIGRMDAEMFGRGGGLRGVR